MKNMLLINRVILSFENIGTLSYSNEMNDNLRIFAKLLEMLHFVLNTFFITF